MKRMGELTEKREAILIKGKVQRGRWKLIGFPCLNFRIARIRQESSEGSKDQRGALSCLHRAR